MTSTPTTSTRPMARRAALVRRLVVVATAATSSLLAACAGPSSHFYTLAEPISKTAARAASPDQPPLLIDFPPMGVPERLSRPQMLVRKAQAPGAQVQLLEFHRWSSSFEYELRDALASGVAARLGAVDATHGMRQAGQGVWRVAVQVRQFDLIEGEQVDAALSWTVRRSDAAPGTPGVTCQWSDREPASAGIEALAQAAQRLTARAADAIARDLTAAQTSTAPGCPR